MPLGIAQAQLAVRETDRPKLKRGRSKSVEGQFWEIAVSQIGPMPNGSKWIYVADREGDLYAFLIACIESGADFVVRAKWNRKLATGSEPIEWILLSSIRIDTIDDAHRIRRIDISRWNIEDFHMCIKTGCQYERSPLDEMRDLGALLGFVVPLALRLLMLRRKKDVLPDARALEHEETLLVTLLATKLGLSREMTVGQFWRGVAQLGGYVGNWQKHPPGWRTLWAGFSKLNGWAVGARLLVESNP